MDQSFKNLEIIKFIEKNHRVFFTKINSLYNISEKILSEIPRVFDNYTLHNIGHSIRVISYMNDLIKSDLKRYSLLHLTIIVYVGLLHDTGMFVSPNEEVSLYNSFSIKYDNFKALTKNEKKLILQEYIRKRHGERVENIINNRINADTNIRSLLYVGDTETYNISSIVSCICNSHTKDIVWIQKNLSDNQEYGEYIINPKHIAFLLRIADALDIDDRRAPYVLYKLLNPQGISDSEWKKHIPITNYNKIITENNIIKIKFKGNTDDPIVYRKIKEYLDLFISDLNRILLISETFIDDYKFRIQLPIEISIDTVGFSQSELKFNLQYSQISKLLMGEKIYGEKKDGLRELLQNAIDAVLLMKDIYKENQYVEYSPCIGIEFNQKNNQIIIFDNGFGMDEEILNKYFLNIGSSYYVSEEFKDTDYSYSPIGHFGIGFLACFMLSSRVEIETKNYLTNELIKLSLDKDSPYITKIDTGNNNYSTGHGTRIVLEYDQVIPSVFEDEKTIKEYIKSNIITDRFRFKIIKNGIRYIKNSGPINKYTLNKNTYYLNYTLEKNINVKFSFFGYFMNKRMAYFLKSEESILYNYDYGIYDIFYSVESLYDSITMLESELQTSKKLINHLYDYEFFSPFLQEILFENTDAIKEYYIRNNNLIGFFDDYFIRLMSQNEYRYYEIPFILSNTIFLNFIEDIRRHNYSRAFKKYRNNIEYITVICNKNELSTSKILDILKDSLIYYDKQYDEVVLDYLEEYPVEPIEKKLDILCLPKHNKYTNINKNYTLFSSKIYLNGIFVKNSLNVLPFVIDGLDIKSIICNIISSEFETDISRNSFDISSNSKLTKDIIRLIYNDIIKKNKFDKDEEELIKYFLEEFYSDDY